MTNESVWTDKVRTFISLLPVETLSAKEAFLQLTASFPESTFTLFGFMQIVRGQNRSFLPVAQKISPTDLAIQEQREELDIIAIERGLIDIHQLQACTCRWPVGEPQDSAFGFCGQPTHSSTAPYCADHREVAFKTSRRPAKRKRVFSSL